MRNDFAHAFRFEELLKRGCLKGINVLELARQEFCHYLTHKANAEGIEHAVESHVLALRNALQKAACRLLTVALHGGELVKGEGVEVCHIVKNAPLKEACHGFRTETINVHRLARNEMLNAPLDLRRTLRVVGAIVCRLAFIAHQGSATFGTRCAEHHLGSRHKRARFGVNTHDLRNDFTRLFYIHIVAEMKV